MDYNANASANSTWTLHGDTQQEVPVMLRSFVVFIVSSLIICSNLLNLSVLRITHQIPMISRICLLNLSCADLLVGVAACAPSMYPAVTGSWPYGVVCCQLSGVIHGTAASVSIWTLALVSMDRYLAIIHPLRYTALVTYRRCVGVIGAAWFLGGVTFLVPIFSGAPDFVYYEFQAQEIMCGMNWTLVWFCLAVLSYVPVLSGAVLIFTTTAICRAVYEMRHTGPYQHQRQPGSSQLRESSFGSSQAGARSSSMAAVAYASRYRSPRGEAWPEISSQSSMEGRSKTLHHPVAHTIQVDLHSPFTPPPSTRAINHNPRLPPSEILKRIWRSDSVAPAPKPPSEDPDVIHIHSCHDNDETPPTDDEAPPTSINSTAVAAENNALPTPESTISNRKVMKVLGATTAVYFITWGPYVISSFILAAWPETELQSVVQFLFVWLANSNSFMNVFIYSAMYSAYRKNVIVMVRKLCHCHVSVSPM